jgi:hypothetical protein
MTTIEEDEAIQGLLAKLAPNPLVDVTRIEANSVNRVFYVYTSIRPLKGSVPRAWGSYTVEYITGAPRPVETVAAAAAGEKGPT